VASSKKKKPKELPATSATIVPALPPLNDRAKELVNWLFPAYITLIVLAVLAFVTKWTMPQGHQMPLDRAVMAAVNAATLTGLPQSTRLEVMKPPGQVIVLILTLAGSLFSFIAGGLAVRRILRLPYSDREIIACVFIVEIIALLLGAGGLCGTDDGVLAGLTQGAAAIGNSAVSLGHLPALRDWHTHVFLLPLAFLGGLGATVLLEIYHLLIGGRRLSTHARTVLVMSLGLYLVSVAIFLILRGVEGDLNTSAKGVSEIFASSSAAAIDSRTAGFAFEMTHSWPRSMQWVVIVLMIIGASPGGSGGGVKTTTFAVLFRGARNSLKGQLSGRAFGIAMTWLATYLAMAIVGIVLLMVVEPQAAADRLVFVSFSALSNVGLAPDVQTLSAKGNYILAALMLAGRMVPLLILWWMVDTTDDADLAVG
jgi:trk system potassium uptake protein TrkH